MKTRIKQLRKTLALTQQAFADKLGLKQNTIAAYEAGRITPSNSAIISICKIYGVNEEWLKTGNGEIFTSPIVSEAFSRMDNIQKTIPVILELYGKLDDNGKKVVREFIKEWLECMEKKEPMDFDFSKFDKS